MCFYYQESFSAFRYLYLFIYFVFQSAQVAALRKLPCFKTPERTPILYDQAQVEKILNYKPSPNPHAVATPPVPIGISENPTPEESKRIQKWLNKLPEKMPSPPPRRDSTASAHVFDFSQDSLYSPFSIFPLSLSIFLIDYSHYMN